MGAMESQIISITIVYSTVYSGADQRKHQSSASLALGGEFTGDRWIPAQMASNAESVSIWWRHHGPKFVIFKSISNVDISSTSCEIALMWIPPQIARFTWPTWGPPGSCRPQVSPMLAPWTLLSGTRPHSWYNQHWCRLGLGVVRQQAKVHSNLCHHMAPHGHNE